MATVTLTKERARIARLESQLDATALQYIRGGSLKALPKKWQVGGYLLRWGSADVVDRSAHKDFFQKGHTNLGRFIKGTLDVYATHGLTKEIGVTILGEATVTPDDQGMRIVANLNPSIPAARAVYAEIKSKADYGWSAGAVAHLCRRTSVLNSKGEKVNRLDAFPVAECSITSEPAEKRAFAFDASSMSHDEASRAHAMKSIRAVVVALDRLQCERILERLNRPASLGLRACRVAERLDRLDRIDQLAHEARFDRLERIAQRLNQTR